jgi:predicted O-methyltransferase YrrM
MFIPKQGEPGHYIKVNDHPIFGYSRYIDVYKNLILQAKDNELFVEIGSFMGQSTAALAAYVAASGKQIEINAIDIFAISDFSDTNHVEVVEAFGGDLYETFLDNMRKAGVAELVKPIQTTSLQAAELYEDRSISYLMIDASHTYEDVVDDIEAWFPKLKVGGIMLGDDYDWESVKRAADDTLGKVNSMGSTWYTVKSASTLEKQKELSKNA